MPVPGGGFEQCYNAQAVVDTESLLVLVPDVTQVPHDKERIAPILAQVPALPEGLSQPEQLAAEPVISVKTTSRSAKPLASNP